MSSVLHPVGPEPTQTYWVRRAAVLSVAILVLAVVVALIIEGTSSGSAVQATPSPPPVSSSPVAAPSSASASPTAKKTKQAKASTASPRKTATAKPTKTKPPAPTACPAADLRPTLTGKQRLKVKAKNTFRLSLINGAGTTCTAEVTAKNFELTIYSGKDRIWSTADCSKAIKTTKKTLKAEQAIEWSLTWNGRRSRSNCKNRPEIPKSGTYLATAQLDGAKPVQLRMIVVN
jgi:hypothetical protein